MTKVNQNNEYHFYYNNPDGEKVFITKMKEIKVLMDLGRSNCIKSDNGKYPLDFPSLYTNMKKCIENKLCRCIDVSK